MSILILPEIIYILFSLDSLPIKIGILARKYLLLIFSSITAESRFNAYPRCSNTANWVEISVPNFSEHVTGNQILFLFGLIARQSDDNEETAIVTAL